VIKGLGLGAAPPAARAAKPTREDLPPSPALSIVQRGPGRFEGRKLGVLLTDGADASLFAALADAVAAQGATLEVIAPHIGGATLSDGKLAAAKQKIDGGPSVLYDAVVVLASPAGAALLATDAAAKDFVTDAFAHCKFVGYTEAAMALFEKAGLAEDIDEGCVLIDKPKDAREFLERCGVLRHWPRELKLDLDR
jgi:catalase